MSAILQGSVEERVRKVIAEVTCIAVAAIRKESTFADALSCDSLDRHEIVMALEDEFDIEILDEEAEKIRTVQDAIDLVTAKVRP